MAHRGHMHKPVLVHANVDERTEGRNVGHGALQNHARFQVRDLIHALLERRGLKLRARVAARLVQLRDDIRHRRHTEGVVGEVRRRQLRQHPRIADELRDPQTSLLRDARHHRVGLRVHGRGIERILTAIDAQEARRLLESLRPQARHLLQLLARGKRAILIAVGHDVGRNRGVHTSHALQQRGRRRVQVHADAIHRVFHHAIERARECDLVDVMLVLPHTNGLRVNLHQLRQRVLQAARDGHRAAQ